MRPASLLYLGFSILLSLVVTAPAATPDQSFLMDRSVAVRQIYYEYPGARKFQSIRDVDFSNMRFFFFYNNHFDDRPNGPGTKESYQLEHSLFSHNESIGHEELSLDDVSFMTSPSGMAKYALASLNFLRCGGSCSDEGFVKVFELRGGRPFEIQEIQYDRQAPGTGVQFSPKTQVFVVTGRFEDSAAHCCADALAVVTFNWDGKVFQMRNAKKEPVKN